MNYGQLIRQAWSITWRNRFLWIFGILATSTVGLFTPGGGNNTLRWRASPADLRNLPAPIARTLEGAGQEIAANPTIVVLVVVIALIAGLALVVLSLIAQGAMAQSTADLARGRPGSLGAAWRSGLNYFWQYLGLWALLVAGAILIAATIGALGGLMFGIAAVATTNDPPSGIVILSALLGLLLLLATIALSVGISIAVAYAQRAIAVENLGPIAALRSGWYLLSGHLGESVIVWLINIALALGIGIALALAIGLVTAVLIGLGLILWTSFGLTVPTGIYAVLGGLALILAAGLLGGIANTFFWNYWTLAYLRLRGTA